MNGTVSEDVDSFQCHAGVLEGTLEESGPAGTFLYSDVLPYFRDTASAVTVG